MLSYLPKWNDVLFPGLVALIGGKALEECLRAVRLQSANCLAVRRDGTAVWAPAGELPLGDLREGREVRRAVYLMSTTRRHMANTRSSS